MKDNKMVKYPVILGIIALVAGLLLALVYNVTAPIIEENRIKRENAVVIEMFGDNVSISDISDTLNDEEKNIGIYSVLKVTSKSKNYYVYKVTIKDSFDGDESSYIVAIDNSSKVYKLKFSSVGDSYASKYSTDSYASKVEGKGSLTNSDTVSGATATGRSIVESINATIAHKGRVD